MLSSPTFKSTFRPSRWRYLSFRILVMIAAYQLCFAVIQMFFNNLLPKNYSPEIWLFNSMIFVSVYSVSLFISTRSMVEDLCIQVANGAIEGPTGVQRKRVRFPIVKIDQVRTRRINWLNHIFQYRHIWSLDGEKITFFPHTFTQSQIEMLFQKLDCLDQ